jgi:hypothetical protein
MVLIAEVPVDLLAVGVVVRERSVHRQGEEFSAISSGLRPSLYQPAIG